MGTVLQFRPRAGLVAARQSCNLSEAVETIMLANLRYAFALQRVCLRVWCGV